MKTSMKIIIGVVVLAVLGILAFVFMQNDDQKAASGSGGDTITYTDSGFNPKTLRAKPGTVITVKNESSEEIAFKSDPHPVHTNNKELNQDDLPAGQSQTFTVTTKGTWGYHNHYDPSKAGTIIVE